MPVAGAAGWYTALAGSRGAPRDAERTTCARILTARSLGVSHPVLPCGAKIFISYSGAEVLTEVIDTKLKQPGRQFELTEALAQQLGIEGTQQIRWRFAQDCLRRSESAADSERANPEAASRPGSPIDYNERARPCTWPCV